MAIVIAFFTGGIIGYALTSLNYDIGYNRGWHQGIDDLIKVLKEMEGDKNDRTK